MQTVFRTKNVRKNFMYIHIMKIFTHIFKFERIFWHLIALTFYLKHDKPKSNIFLYTLYVITFTCTNFNQLSIARKGWWLWHVLYCLSSVLWYSVWAGVTLTTDGPCRKFTVPDQDYLQNANINVFILKFAFVVTWPYSLAYLTELINSIYFYL